MDEEKIHSIYKDLSLLSKPGEEAPIEQPTEIVAGQDDRKDVHQLGATAAEALQRKLTASTVILTNKSRVSQNQDGSFTLDVRPFRQGGLPPCSGERFAGQHTGGWCSGFLVGADVIATAGHCGETEDAIKDTAYVFGFQVDEGGNPGRTEYTSDLVYFGKELIAHDLSSSGDFAIVRVDRPVTAPGAEPLEVRASGNPALGDNLGVIGYPSGLPAKIAFGPETKLLRDQDPWLISNLDTYGGNSGSAVFNTDGLVEGILVRGAQDYISNGSCFRTNVVDNSAGSEAVTKASVFQSKIPS